MFILGFIIGLIVGVILGGSLICILIGGKKGE